MTKPFYESTAIQGNLITIGGMLIKWLGLPVMQTELEAIVSAVFIIAGAGYAIYGRIKTNGESLDFSK